MNISKTLPYFFIVRVKIIDKPPQKLSWLITHYSQQTTDQKKNKKPFTKHYIDDIEWSECCVYKS